MAVTIRVTGETLRDGELVKVMQTGDTLTLDVKVESENCDTHEFEEHHLIYHFEVLNG